MKVTVSLGKQVAHTSGFDTTKLVPEQEKISAPPSEKKEVLQKPKFKPKNSTLVFEDEPGFIPEDDDHSESSERSSGSSVSGKKESDEDDPAQIEID